MGDVCTCGHREGMHACVNLSETRCVCGCNLFRRPALPLGSVIAVCGLVDVVPTGEPAVGGRIVFYGNTLDLFSEHWVRTPTERSYEVDAGQELLGDFSPGRYAWLLEDARPIEPQEARGWQGLWDWRAAEMAR